MHGLLAAEYNLTWLLLQINKIKAYIALLLYLTRESASVIMMGVAYVIVISQARVGYHCY